jgi:hypothetical protein
MSLEDVIKENTAVLKSLVELLSKHTAGLATGAPVPLTEAPKAEKPKDEPTEVKLSYEDDVRKPFLALLNSKRDVALKLLADLGVANLKGFEGKPETYADLAGKIKEAANG